MSKFDLTKSDIFEIVASLLLAEMNQKKRLEISVGPSLPLTFVPDASSIPHLDTAQRTINQMFGISASLTPSTSLENWATEIHQLWLSSEKKVTFFTSGTTGIPKPTTHDFSLHVQEVLALAKIFKERQRIVSFVPCHHIYGFLFSILLPKVMDVSISKETPLPLPTLSDTLLSGDLVVAFPLFWKTFVKLDIRFKNNIHGVTSTGPCPAETIETLKTNGLASMYEVYGSSETGGVGYRTSPQAHYSLLSHWSKGANHKELIRQHPAHGELRMELQDALSWDGLDFIPIRRIDNCVQVAGVNVSPDRVQSVLLEHPEIQECSIRLMRQDEGDRLKAFLVPSKEASQQHLVRTIKIWAQSRLSQHELPGQWKVGNSLPTNPMGKVTDWD